MDSAAMFSFALGRPRQLGFAVDGPNASPIEQEDRGGQFPFAVFGRASQCDVTLPHKSVSLRHLYVQQVNDRVFAADLFTSNGSKLAGSALKAGWWPAVKNVEVGPYELTHNAAMVGGAEPPSPLEFKPRSMQSEFYGRLPEVRLQLKGHGGQSWPINRVITLLGRSSKCRITCGDESVSATHCALVLTPSGLWAVDLVTRTGITINGEPKRFGLLAEGHEIQIGKYVMTPIYDRPPVEVDASPQTPNAAYESAFMLPKVDFTMKNNKVFKVDIVGETLVITPQGDLKDFFYQDFQVESNSVVSGLTSHRYKHCVIDFGQVHIVNSVMIEAITGFCRSARGNAALCSATPEMYQVLDEMNLPKLWLHYANRDDAVTAVTYDEIAGPGRT